MEYCFILGKNPEISIAELGCFFRDLEITKNRSAVFVKNFSLPQNFLDKLGGTIEILEIFERGISADKIENAIFEFLKKSFSSRDSKCKFAVNLIPEHKNSNVLRRLLPAIKKNLRKSGVRANFMNKNFANVSAVLAFKQNLAKEGSNISIIDEGENLFSLGFSAAIQNFESYSKRDYGKLFRDAQVGMLPPKLAQIMVNLAASKNPSSLIFDPFCGTGTILMEALLMGLCAIGSDSDSRLTAGAQNNIEWLRKNFKIPANAKSKIFQKDATKICADDFCDFAEITDKKIAIVTEPHLGPPLTDFPARQFLEKLIADLGALYINFFENLAGWLPKGSSIIFIFPVWNKSATERVRMSDKVIDKIEALGYSKTAFDPLQKTSLFYERPGQIVGREIVRFIKA